MWRISEGRMVMKQNRRFLNQSLRTKLILPVMLTLAVSLSVNLMLFNRINTTVENMDEVYDTNIRLGSLERVLTDMESSLYQYLNIQSQAALESFIRSREEFEGMISENTITDHPARRMERNIRNLGYSYLELTDQAIAAKQIHDVSSYKESYEELQAIYGYLLNYISGLDTLRFKTNSENYDISICAIWKFL